ncbi:MAG TPA: 2-C-methyl-D-erythritol 4-phosphate cytidylyltransferase [Candidatus Cybelea sp.]|nr:2-C-methyl-D-erythritol 4-phosphate cytidylyltransferase [Candidatus Cybelea sp.]
MKWGAAIVAAGSGKRLGRPKQFIEIAGLPMVGWSIQTFAAMPEIARLVIATEPESIDAMLALVRRLAPSLAHAVIAGGKTRQESARECVVALADDCDAIFVHDGARPLIATADVRAGMREVRRGRGALLAEPVVDTIKRADAGTLLVYETLERGELWAAQTPQFAWAGDLLAAHERAREERRAVTDDAALLEYAGIEVVVVPASGQNFKVTLAQDVARADAILRRRPRTLAAG